MPRRRIGSEEPRRMGGPLVDRLAEELKGGRESGQPLIYEKAFPSGKLRVNVIWDQWDHLPLEERTETILRAYEQAEGRDSRETIALASGLTAPEAYAAGMLPFQIIPAIRRDDPVTIDQCLGAMIDEGASILFGPDRPQLRFASQEEAEAAWRRLGERLPGSEVVWAVIQDVGKAEEWLHS